MPIFTVPNHVAVDFFEANTCHNPACGPNCGGRFCGDAASQAAQVAGKEKFQQLRTRWDQINQRLLNGGLHGESTEAKALEAEQVALVKEINRLDIDSGGLDGIGEPGGPRDIVIVGAGPGGLTAAIHAGYEGLDCCFVEASDVVGGQARDSSRVENFPGFPIGIRGADLADKLHEQAVRAGSEGKLGVRVVGMTYDAETGMKTVKLSNGETIEARAVIIAGGVEVKKINFPGSDAKNVVYRDSETLARATVGKPVVILGGSNGAAQAALRASQTSDSVTVIARSALTKGMSKSQISALRNNPKVTVIEGDELAELVSDSGGNPQFVLTKKGQKLPTAALGLFIGSEPGTEWLSGIKTTGTKHNKAAGGKIVTDSAYETSMPGVFAVGDIREGGGGRMIAAAGEGSIAVRNAFSYFERLQEARDKSQGKVKESWRSGSRRRRI